MIRRVNVNMLLQRYCGALTPFLHDADWPLLEKVQTGVNIKHYERLSRVLTKALRLPWLASSKCLSAQVFFKNCKENCMLFKKFPGVLNSSC